MNPQWRNNNKHQTNRQTNSQTDKQTFIMEVRIRTYSKGRGREGSERWRSRWSATDCPHRHASVYFTVPACFTKQLYDCMNCKSVQHSCTIYVLAQYTCTIKSVILQYTVYTIESIQHNRAVKACLSHQYTFVHCTSFDHFPRDCNLLQSFDFICILDCSLCTVL